MHRLVSSEAHPTSTPAKPDGAVLILDDHGVRLSVGAVALLHRSDADADVVALDAIVPRQQPDGRQSVAVFSERIAAVRGGQSQAFRYEFRRGDGHPLDALVSMSTEGAGTQGSVRALLEELPPFAANAEALRGAALAVSGAEGDMIFKELTRYLATTLGVEYSFISSCSADVYDRVRTLAIYTDGTFEENVEYALAGTACGTVVGQQFRIVQEGVQREYPEDRMFRRWSTEAYAAYPLNDSIGRPLGLIAVLSRRRIENVDLVESMLKIFEIGRAHV